LLNLRGVGDLMAVLADRSSPGAAWAGVLTRRNAPELA
jgi:hypothetical protein